MDPRLENETTTPTDMIRNLPETIRVIVAGTNRNGESDLFFTKVQATGEQVESGNHYERAEAAAVKAGYQRPLVAFDEEDPAGRAIVGLYEWASRRARVPWSLSA